jgi:hypothetical protein
VRRLPAELQPERPQVVEEWVVEECPVEEWVVEEWVVRAGRPEAAECPVAHPVGRAQEALPAVLVAKPAGLRLPVPRAVAVAARMPAAAGTCSRPGVIAQLCKGPLQSGFGI